MLDASYIAFECVININYGHHLDYFGILEEIFNGRQKVEE